MILVYERSAIYSKHAVYLETALGDVINEIAELTTERADEKVTLHKCR